MAFTASAILEVESGASDTTGVGVFDPGVAGMDATGSVASANTSAPVVTVNGEAAGDVNMWFYLKSATNSIPGFYQITAVDTVNHTYTLNAAIGAAVLTNYTPNTAVGCATTSTLSSVTWAVDFSQTTGNIATGTVTTAAAIATATTAIFRKPMVGNGITNGSAWRVIVGYTSTTVVTLDASPTWTAQSVSVGGALATPKQASTLGVSGNAYWIKSGTYGSTTAIAPTGNFIFSGYASIRGDRPTGATRPILQATAGSINIVTAGGTNISIGYIVVDGNSQTSVTGISGNNRQLCVSVKALSCATGFTSGLGCTFCEANGCTTGFVAGYANCCYATGGTTSFSSVLNCSFCIAVSSTTGFLCTNTCSVINCDAYSCTTGINLNTGSYCIVRNNICSTCTTGINGAFTNGSYLENNAGWNNGTNVATLTSGYNVGFVTLGSDPFISASGGNFALTPAAIALIGSQGIPGTFPGLSGTVGYTCVGAVQPLAQGIFVESNTAIIMNPLSVVGY